MEKENIQRCFQFPLSQYVVSKSYQNDNFLVDFSFEIRHIWGICFQLDIFSLRNLKQKKKKKKQVTRSSLFAIMISFTLLLPDGLEKEN